MDKMSIEIIKPSSATPPCLRTLHLSAVDSLMQPVYTFACLFYTNNHTIQQQEQTIQKLKTSLSETLTNFYPFAGRINGLVVDCNDEGAVFVESTLAASSTLSSFLTSPDSNLIQHTLLPLHAIPNPNEASMTWPLVLVKATYFQCGGMSLGICISHKLADASSLSTFIRVWAAVARGESGTVKPEFAGVKLYPPANDSSRRDNLRAKIHAGKGPGVTKRFVFSESKIKELKTKVGRIAQIRPTRVQCVTALLWRCVSVASQSTSSTKVLVHPANLRTKIPSLLSENLMGNVIHSSMTFSRKGEEIEIQETVMELRKRAEELTSLVQENDGPTGPATVLGSKLLGKLFDDYSKLSNEPCTALYAVTSWCNMPFYEANFGNGCPVWVLGNVAPPLLNYVTMLLDSNDFKGIEAWVTLSEEDMVSFERNREVLAFASPNPAVIF